MHGKGTFQYHINPDLEMVLTITALPFVTALYFTWLQLEVK